MADLTGKHAFVTGGRLDAQDEDDTPGERGGEPEQSESERPLVVGGGVQRNEPRGGCFPCLPIERRFKHGSHGVIVGL